MNSYRQLRQPIPQVLALLTLLLIGLSSVSYLQGVTIYTTPIYLIITTTIELIIIIMSFLGLFYKPHKTSINSWRFYFVLTVSTCYSVIFSLYNTYFFVALQTDHYLDKYWYYGFGSMAFFFLCNIVANCIMVKAKTKKTQNYRYIFRGIGYLVYVVYIIYYFIVPDEIPNQKIFLYLIVITLGSQVASDYTFLVYGAYKYSIDHGEDPDE